MLESARGGRRGGGTIPLQMTPFTKLCFTRGFRGQTAFRALGRRREDGNTPVQIPLLTHRNVHVSGIKKLRFPFLLENPKITISVVGVCRLPVPSHQRRHSRGSKTLTEVWVAGNADGERRRGTLTARCQAGGGVALHSRCDRPHLQC